MPLLWLFFISERGKQFVAKRKKTIAAGCIVKTILYTAPEPRDGERVRAEKSRMTTAAQKAMNDKTARGRLEMLLAANFIDRDLFVTLTYRNADLPEKRAGAVKNVRQFLKNLRKHRKARGQELKYIYTTEEKPLNNTRICAILLPRGKKRARGVRHEKQEWG